MKQSALIFATVLISVIGLLWLSTPEFKEYLTRHTANIAGIHAEVVYAYQSSKGLQRQLVQGDTGKDVTLVQHALRSLQDDFPDENITGYYGPATQSAIMQYQKSENLPITGIIDDVTRAALHKIYLAELCPQVENDDDEDEFLHIVNRSNPLKKEYVPSGLIDISDRIKTTGIVCLKEEVVADLEKMFADAYRNGHILAATSGYRAPEIQSIVYRIWHSILGTEAKYHIAEPMHSEHQLGTTVDLTAASNSFVGADEYFGMTPEGQWVKANAHLYGFVMSNPSDTTTQGGYIYEPWHFRYVGVVHAREIIKKGIPLDEYLKAQQKKIKDEKKRNRKI